MTYLERILKASNDLIAKDKEITALQEIAVELRATVARQEEQITALQCQLRRSTLPFNRDRNQSTPALLRPQV